MVCQLVRSIYGLRQSGARWEAKLAMKLLDMGFERSDADPCLYKITRGGDKLILCVYVDDLCFASSSDAFRKIILDEISASFKLKDTGNLTWMLNTNINQNLAAGSVSISQKIYIDDATATFFPEGIPKTSERVMPTDEALVNLAPLSEGEMIDPRYRSGVGKLVWLVAISRPDVAYAHSMLARHNQGGGERHMASLIKVFRYLARTSHFKIEYGKKNFKGLCSMIEENSEFKTSVLDLTTMFSMSDASHGGERPMAGNVEILCAGPIAWRAYRLPVTPLSVTQGEYMAATQATVESLSQRDIHRFIGLEQEHPTIIFCDNMSAVQLADGNSSSKRMKHISTRIAFLREQIADKAIMLYHIRTQGQLADIFTKACTANTFHSLRTLLLN